MSDRLETLSYICDEILTNHNVNAQTVLNATKLASEDNYLYELMVDYAKATDSMIRDMYLTDILSYTDEKLRMVKIK